MDLPVSLSVSAVRVCMWRLFIYAEYKPIETNYTDWLWSMVMLWPHTPHTQPQWPCTCCERTRYTFVSIRVGRITSLRVTNGKFNFQRSHRTDWTIGRVYWFKYVVRCSDNSDVPLAAVDGYRLNVIRLCVSVCLCDCARDRMTRCRT